MFGFRAARLISGFGICLFAASSAVAQMSNPSSKQPIEPSNLASYQGRPLYQLTKIIPPNMVGPLLLHFRIKAAANGSDELNSVSNAALLQYKLDLILYVGNDVGEEDLIYATENPKLAAYLQNQSCILELFPANLNFTENIENWDNYIFCLKPAPLKDSLTPTTAEPSKFN